MAVGERENAWSTIFGIGDDYARPFDFRGANAHTYTHTRIRARGIYRPRQMRCVCIYYIEYTSLLYTYIQYKHIHTQYYWPSRQSADGLIDFGPTHDGEAAEAVVLATRIHRDDGRGGAGVASPPSLGCHPRKKNYFFPFVVHPRLVSRRNSHYCCSCVGHTIRQIDNRVLYTHSNACRGPL